MFLKEMRNFIFRFVFSRFGVSSNKNLNKKMYLGDLECSYLGGSLSICEEIFTMNRNGEFENKDDVIARLHIIYLECFNEFQTKYGFKVVDKATLDKPIKLSEVENDREITFC